MVRLVGERYADCGFSNFVVGQDKYTPSRQKQMEKVRAYATDILQHREAGRNLIMIGTCGTGKDHLATAVMRHAIVKGLNVMFARGTTLAEKMILAVKNGEKLDERYQMWDVLCISDIEPQGNAEASPYVLASYLDLIDERYRRKLPTIVTSNVANRDEMAKAIGARCVDRLLHDAVVARMVWPTARTEVRNG